MIDLKNNLFWLCWCVLIVITTEFTMDAGLFGFFWQTVKRRLHRSVLTIKIPPNTAAMNLLSRAAQRLATWTKGPWGRRCDDTKLETIPTTCSFEKGEGGGGGVPYLLAQRHPAAESTGQTDDFGYKCFKSQVLLQDHPPEDSLHFRNTRTWVGMMERKEKVSWKKAITERECGNEGGGGGRWGE